MKTLFFTFFLFISSFCIAQNIVIDSDTNKPIPYVNILVKNTDIGYYANNNGEYNLEFKVSNGEFTFKNYIKKGDTIIFSAIGYEEKEIVFNDFEQLKVVKLSKNIELLNEVIINSNQKYQIKEIGVKSKKNSYMITGTTKLAVFIPNDKKLEDFFIINELIFRKLKTKFINRKYDFKYNGVQLKSDRYKSNNDLAVKIQLYKVNKQTKLPSTKDPLINKEIVIKLEKNTKKLKYDISKLNITLPKEGVFLSLEILGFFNTFGGIEKSNGLNIFTYGLNRVKNKNDVITYIYNNKNKEWSKSTTMANALFSLKVAYPIKK